MKKIIFSVVLSAISFPVFAQHGHHQRHHHHHWHYNNNWIAPAIIGGVIGYALTRPEVVVVEQQRVQPAPVCTEWREILQSDGTVIRERFCRQ